MSRPRWQDLRLDPRSLAAERLQLHYATIVLASAAHSLLPAADDDSHTNLGVDEAGRLLVTQPLRTGQLQQVPLQRCALDLSGLELQWLHGDEPTERMPLAGRTLAEALAWADRTARSRAGAGVSRRTFPDFPEGPVGAGGRFAAGAAAARAELGRWYDNALALFEALSMREAALSPIRVWPHHFDLGAVLPLGGETSIGFGLSPGDEFFDEPYLYASPSPEPERALPALTGPGRWLREGFTSVILTGTEVRAQRDQAGTARTWLESALAACRAALS